MSESQENQVIITKDIVVLYHAHCPDGFGAAYIAHKKFGDDADYVPCKRGAIPPQDLEGKLVYVLDYSFSYDEMKSLVARARKVITIDHHVSAEEEVKLSHEYVFDVNFSGAYLTWTYFFPNDDVPDFIKYLSDGDRAVFTRPYAHELCAYIYSQPHTYESFDRLVKLFSSEDGKRDILERSKELLLYRDKIVTVSLESVHFVRLEGVLMPAINAALPIDERSYVLAKVYELYPPVALMYRFDGGVWKCSLRSNGSFDCTLIATKHEGGGHKGAAGFVLHGNGDWLPGASFVSKEEALKEFGLTLSRQV